MTAYLKQLVGAITIICAFIDPILAAPTNFSKKNAIHYRDTPGYYYAGMAIGAGSLQVNKVHKALAQYTTLSSFPSPSGGVILGLFAGRQMTPYMAIELALVEWYIGDSKYQVYDGYISKFPGSKKSSTNYTVGPAFDFVPMVPISDIVSLLGVVGIGWKTAGIEILNEKVFNTIGWKPIPRIGLGAVVNDECARLSGKILVEFNNVFQNNKESIFRPSLLLCMHVGINFN